MSSVTNSTQFNVLPDDVLPRIFNELPLESYAQCRKVCKLWKQAADSLPRHVEFIALPKILKFLSLNNIVSCSLVSRGWNVVVTKAYAQGILGLQVKKANDGEVDQKFFCKI